MRRYSRLDQPGQHPDSAVACNASRPLRRDGCSAPGGWWTTPRVPGTGTSSSTGPTPTVQLLKQACTPVVLGPAGNLILCARLDIDLPVLTLHRFRDSLIKNHSYRGPEFREQLVEQDILKLRLKG